MTVEIEKKELVKGGEYLIKKSEPENVFIPEDLTEDQKMMAGVAQEFVEKEILPNLDRIDKLEPGLSVSLFQKSGELGLLGVTVPEEFGGLGEDLNTNTAILAEMGGAFSFSVSFAAHTGIGTLPILYYGTKEQKEK